MNDMIKQLYEIGLIPVIKIEDANDAVPLAKALIDGGLPAAEITFRTSCAAEAIKKITEDCTIIFTSHKTLVGDVLVVYKRSVHSLDNYPCEDTKHFCYRQANIPVVYPTQI